MYEIHPAALVIPRMDDEQYQLLLDDIREFGQKVPIELYEGKVIDGRHRQEACHELGIEPEYIEVEELGNQSPTQYSWSLNGPRRHWDKSQLAAVGAMMVPQLQKEARERQKTSTGGSEPQLREKIPEAEKQAEKGRARDKAAAIVGVNPRYVADAAKLKEEDPDTFQEVLEGKTTLAEAKRKCQPQEPKCGGGKASIVQDSIGRKVPDHLREPFERAVLLATIAKRLDPIRREVEEISGQPGGEHLSMSNINESVRMLKSYIKGGSYLTECPKCRGKVKDNCGRCSGAGYICQDQKGRLSDEEKGWLGI